MLPPGPLSLDDIDGPPLLFLDCRALPGLQDSLGSCGLTVLGRATAEQIPATVRTAFDPVTRGDVSRLTASSNGVDLSRWLDWDDVLSGRTPQLSPWCQLQLRALADHPGIQRLRTPT